MKQLAHTVIEASKSQDLPGGSASGRPAGADGVIAVRALRPRRADRVAAHVPGKANVSVQIQKQEKVEAPV